MRPDRDRLEASDMENELDGENEVEDEKEEEGDDKAGGGESMSVGSVDITVSSVVSGGGVVTFVRLLLL